MFCPPRCETQKRKRRMTRNARRIGPRSCRATVTKNSWTREKKKKEKNNPTERRSWGAAARQRVYSYYFGVKRANRDERKRQKLNRETREQAKLHWHRKRERERKKKQLAHARTRQRYIIQERHGGGSSRPPPPVFRVRRLPFVGATRLFGGDDCGEEGRQYLR